MIFKSVFDIRSFVYRFHRFKIWWSPCPSRECPDEDETVDFVLDRCVDHCQSSIVKPTDDPADDKDDLDFHISHKIQPPILSNSR